MSHHSALKLSSKAKENLHTLATHEPSSLPSLHIWTLIIYIKKMLKVPQGKRTLKPPFGKREKKGLLEESFSATATATAP